MSPIDIRKLGGFLTFSPDRVMPFPGLEFFFLFLCFMVFFVALRRRRTGKVAVTALFSLFFYYLTSGYGVAVLVSSVLVNFFLSRILSGLTSERARKTVLAVAVGGNIGILLYFKYTNFFIQQAAHLGWGSGAPLRIILPLGISFYTFQAISYLVDVYRRKGSPFAGLLDFAFFICFFPKLLAGPLARLGDFGEQIVKERGMTKEDVDRGVWLIVSGLVKKMVIADYVGLNFVDRVFASPLQYTGIENLAAVYGYAIQIYCDFSGYTDIAIGIALFMGYKLPPNFNSPYAAVNVRDFWRRWHISLSLWFQEYLYIPLGGNRRGKVRQWVNCLVVMGLCGFWHGASWNFIIWGLIHGAGIVACSSLSMNAQGWRRIAGVFLTFHFVCLAWIFFRADSLTAAAQVLGQITNAFDMQTAGKFFAAYWHVIAFILAGYALHSLPARVKDASAQIISRMPLPLQSLLLACAIWLVMQLRGSAPMPFIYLQF
jgi:alginate O-acetyltransferase complex protein AlgI